MMSAQAEVPLLARKMDALRTRLASVERAIASYDRAVSTGAWPDGRRPPEATPGEIRLGLLALRDRTRAALRRLEEEAGSG